MINENHLEVFKIAINDFDGMNRSDEDYESDFQKLEDIYNFVDKFIKNNRYPLHELLFSDDMVCEDCGSNEWHINLTYNNRNGSWSYGEIDFMGQETGEDTWCHKCEGFVSLIDPDEYEGEGSDD